MQDDDDHKDDFALFREQMQDVTPLKPDKRYADQRKKPAARLKRREEFDDSEDRFADISFEAVDYDDVPEILSFSRPGIQHSKLAKLRQGKLQIEESIDLHGSTVAQARDYLLEFLAEARHRQLAVIRIVHGKGNRSKNQVPVIKANLNRWLREAPEVLAFHSAPQHDGGSGAVYVLLKRG